MTTSEVLTRRCSHEGCGVTPHLVLDDPDGVHAPACFSHAAWLEEDRELARSKGGLRKAAKDRKAPRYLDTHDLGDLETPADAQRWASIIAGATVTGRLSSNAASVALKALQAWLESHEQVALFERLAELEAQMARTITMTKGGRT